MKNSRHDCFQVPKRIETKINSTGGYIALFSPRFQSPEACSRPVYLELAKPDPGQQESSDDIRKKIKSRRRLIVQVATVLLELETSCVMVYL